MHVVASKGDSHETLAKAIKMLVEIHCDARSIDDSADLQIIVREHDTEIACAPLNMATAWRNRKAESCVADPCHIEIAASYHRVIQ